MTTQVTLSSRPYGSHGGQRWRVEWASGSLEHRDYAAALAWAEAEAARRHCRLVIEDRPPEEQLLFDRTSERATSVAVYDIAWAELCDEAITRMAVTGEPFQAHDLLRAGLAEPSHPNLWGNRFQHAARRGVIEAIGYAQSSRPTTRASVLRIWRGTKATQARRTA